MDDVAEALSRGVNYLNWCGHPDSLSRAVAALGPARKQVVVAVQFQARDRAEAEREFDWILHELATDYLDVATLYYVESDSEWSQLSAPGGVLEYLEQQKRLGRLRLIGLTSHQRKLAARWARSGRLDLLMVRYNAAHLGAEEDVFPATQELGIPVVTYTALRWKALLRPTPDDPPGFQPPPAVEWYRFCLAHPAVAVVLAAPSNRSELAHVLTLLDDWRAPLPEERAVLLAHGARVRRHAGPFP
ncbi:MAG: aldo/keto reductase [Bryobacteraceae bacterium]|nr:aldo/keto reductase [Bryobacteraceae bacterium]